MPCGYGYVVFPTPVGVFPILERLVPFGFESSPRPWGCFSYQLDRLVLKTVFPTPVGVFLTPSSLWSPL